MNIGEASIPDALRAAGKHIKHIHMNETNRKRLGQGHADHKAIIRTLKEIGYSGYITVYMPQISQDACLSYVSYEGTLQKRDVRNRPDLNIILEESLRYLKEIEHTIEMQRQTFEMDSRYGNNSD